MTLASPRPAAGQTFEIRPFGNLGAEILGIDLARPLNADDFARVHRAHLDHHVVYYFHLLRDHQHHHRLQSNIDCLDSRP